KAKQFAKGEEVSAWGVVDLRGGKWQLKNGDVESLKDEGQAIHPRRIIPMHRAADGIYARTIRELVFFALERLVPVADPMPKELVGSEGLESYDWAIRKIHFPDSPEELTRAQERLKFDELFTLELGVAFRKRRVAASEVGVSHDADTVLLKRFLEALPFELTKGQERAVAE